MNNYKNGDCAHLVWVERPGRDPSVYPVVESPVVMLANDEDGHYATEYNSWEEVNELIAQLRKCAIEAFGEEPK